MNLENIALNALEELDESQNGGEQDNNEQANGDENHQGDATNNGEQESQDDGGDNSNDDGGGDNSNDDADNDGDDSGDSDEGDDDADDKNDADNVAGLTDEQLRAEAEKRGLLKKEESEQRKPESTKPIERPDEIANQVWQQMAPEAKVIYSRLPYIKVTDKDGTVESIKTLEQLPKGFLDNCSEDEKARLNAAINIQEQEATKIANKIEEIKEQANQQQIQERERQSVVGDVGRLQRDKIIPQFKAKPGTKEFDSDPALILVNKALSYRQEAHKNGDRISLYNAMLAYKALHPTEFNAPKPKSDERKKIAKQVSGTGKSGAGGDGGGQKAEGSKFPAGTPISDILDYYENTGELE